MEVKVSLKDSIDKNNGDSFFADELAEECYEELSGSSHMMSKIIDQQNELSSSARFAIPKTNAEVMQAQHSLVPGTMAKSTKWAVNILENVEQNRYELNGDRPSLQHLLSLKMLNNWLCKFVLKIRWKDGKEYPPNTL